MCCAVGFADPLMADQASEEATVAARVNALSDRERMVVFVRVLDAFAENCAVPLDEIVNEGLPPTYATALIQEAKADPDDLNWGNVWSIVVQDDVFGHESLRRHIAHSIVSETLTEFGWRLDQQTSPTSLRKQDCSP